MAIPIPFALSRVIMELKKANATVDALFKGEKADEIKNRAMNISQMMMQKAVD
uniref:hypothetical protein n=1 Tax=Flavobacterium sp. TaxID=239 RepID=UPI0040480FC0